MNQEKLWSIYNEIIYNWQGYIIITARNSRIDAEDLLDAVLAHVIEFKTNDIKKVITKKAIELRYRKEIPYSKLEKEDEDNYLDYLQFKFQKEEIPETDKDNPLDKLPEDIKEYLLARIRIEKTLPIKERIKFRKILQQAKEILLGGLN